MRHSSRSNILTDMPQSVNSIKDSVCVSYAGFAGSCRVWRGVLRDEDAGLSEKRCTESHLDDITRPIKSYQLEANINLPYHGV